jgi:hypothetical protein
MAKKAKTPKAAKSTAKVTKASKPRVEKSIPGTIVLLPTEATFTGARLAWYEALKSHAGKPVEDFLSACKANPPAMPKSGKAEDPRGWFQFFQRSKLVEVSGE